MDFDFDYATRVNENADTLLKPPRNDESASTTRQTSALEQPDHGFNQSLRFQVILAAPTAMVKHASETPMTYLNKGQAYTVTIRDVSPLDSFDGLRHYRSTIRIFFDEEGQRERPVRCWRLWKEGRGVSEVKPNYGRYQAIVPNIPADGDLDESIKLRWSALDSFSFTWTSPRDLNDNPHCSVSFRCHFLGTDFSETKGVKGSPVRLYVKTTEMTANPNGFGNSAEWCYCKVKLFRDHGAERKLSIEVAHVKITISKLKEQVAQFDSQGVSSMLKRKRRSSISVLSARPSSPESVTQSDLMAKIARLEAMFTSTRPLTSVDIQGAFEDDPDENPLPSSLESTTWHKSESREGRPTTPRRMSSHSSYGSSPPRASSVGDSSGHITPELIPFESHSFWAPTKDVAPPQPEATQEQSYYRYSPINSTQVRLMALAAGDKDMEIQCMLKVIPVTRLKGSQLVYQALSYSWGTQPASRSIYMSELRIDESLANNSGSNRPLPNLAKPRKLLVRPNLYSALKRLRMQNEVLWFWIDAICMNQNDNSEKSHQLPQMLEIYCNAWNVCIWLGEPEPVVKGGSHDPFDFVTLLVNLKFLDHVMTSSDVDESIMASFAQFAALLKRPWFSRRWVIQEVAASTRASVQYGDKKINWIDFSDAVQLFVLNIDRIRAHYRQTKFWIQNPDAFEYVESSEANTIVQTTNNILRKSEKGDIVARMYDLESLVLQYVRFKTTEPRDIIYALLPLATSTPWQPRPDYEQPILSVYIRFVRFWIENRRSLNIICRHWAPSSVCKSVPSEFGWESILGKDQLLVPSWIGNAQNSAFGAGHDSTGRINGDSLVGKPGDKIYNASQGNVRADDISYNRGLGNRFPSPHFRVYGGDFARVTHCAPRIIDGIIPCDGLEVLGWQDRSHVNSLPDHLWRTLVADRATDGSKAPSWWRRACMFALSMANRDGDLNTVKLLTNHTIPGTVHAYVKRVQEVVWNRRIFNCAEVSNGAGVLESSGPERLMVGIGPRDMQSTDSIYVLLGCSVPVVLRQVEGKWRLIGECFVFGIMDGEAMHDHDFKSQMRSFSLY